MPGLDAFLWVVCFTIKTGRIRGIGFGRQAGFAEAIAIEESIQRAPADAEQAGRALLVTLRGLQHFEHLFPLQRLERAG